MVGRIVRNKPGQPKYMPKFSPRGAGDEINFWQVVIKMNSDTTPEIKVRTLAVFLETNEVKISAMTPAPTIRRFVPLPPTTPEASKARITYAP